MNAKCQHWNNVFDKEKPELSMTACNANVDHDCYAITIDDVALDPTDRSVYI